MVFLVLMWVLFGLIIGGLGRFLVPGRNRIGILLTILIGIVGSIGGGAATRALMGAGHTVITFLISVVFAAILVALASGGYGRRRSWR